MEGGRERTREGGGERETWPTSERERDVANIQLAVALPLGWLAKVH
jgi:hypothetical protein